MARSSRAAPDRTARTRPTSVADFLKRIHHRTRAPSIGRSPGTALAAYHQGEAQATGSSISDRPNGHWAGKNLDIARGVAIGMACGFGFYGLAVVVTVVGLFCTSPLCRDALLRRCSEGTMTAVRQSSENSAPARSR